MIVAFDTQEAAQYGVDEAIMINYFRYWIRHNRANNHNQIDGKFWTYNTIPALSSFFGFWTEKQVRRILNSLMDQDVLVKANHNQKGYDRTTWYSFTRESFIKTSNDNIIPNGQMDQPKRAEASDQTGRPIPLDNHKITSSKDIHSAPRQMKRPDADEVQQYLDERNITKFKGDQFVDYYIQVGWKVGKAGKPMKDWKAAVRQWERRDGQDESGRNNRGQGSFIDQLQNNSINR